MKNTISSFVVNNYTSSSPNGFYNVKGHANNNVKPIMRDENNSSPMKCVVYNGG